MNVAFSMVFMRMNFHFRYPFMTSSGSFANGVGRSPGNCAIYGNGFFWIRAFRKCSYSHNIKTYILMLNTYKSAELDYHLTAHLVVRGGSLEMGTMNSAITIGGFQSNIGSFVGTQEQSNWCNRILEDWMPFLFTSNAQTINLFMDNLMRPVASSYISGLTLQDLLNLIVEPNPPPTCFARNLFKDITVE